MNLDTIGGRRFLLALGSGIVTTILVWCRKITGDVYAAVVIATVAAYITGGTAQKFVRSQPQDGS